MAISGEDLSQARHRAGMTQDQLGAAVGVTGRTIRDWEATEVPRTKEGRVLQVDGLWGEPKASPLESFSDMALLLELGRRFEELRSDPNPESQEKPNSTHNKSSETPTSGTGPRTGRRGPRNPEA